MKNDKSLGQHWLKDRATLDLIADLCADTYTDSCTNLHTDLRAGSHADSPVDLCTDTRTGSHTCPHECLEIGPGLGTLTSSLLRRFAHVTAVEYDERLARNLPASFPGKNLTVINQDFLDFDLTSLPRPFVVAGNIPYYITSPIIHKLLDPEKYTPKRINSEADHDQKLASTEVRYSSKPVSPPADYIPRRIVLLIQKEVAERLAATPGHHTYFSIFAQNRAQVALGPVVDRELFTPPPKVDSRIIIFDPYPAPLVSDTVMKFAKLGFSAPRKKLAHNLAAGLRRDKTEIITALKSCDIDPDVRPAALDLFAWRDLHSVLA